MGKKPNIADMSTRLLVVTLGSERRWKRVALIGGAALLAIGAVVVVVLRANEAEAVAALETSWSRLQLCMIGPDALPQGVTAATRVTQIQLGIVGVSRERRAKPNELAWPAICAAPAFAVAEASRNAGKDSATLADAAQALGTALRDDVNATRDNKAEVERVFSDPMIAKIRPVPAGDAPAAPKPATVLFPYESFKQLPKLVDGSFGLASLKPETSPAARLRMLIDQKDLNAGPLLCAAQQTDTTVRCAKVPDAAAKLSPGIGLFGAIEEKARPYLFAGDRGQLGIFAPDAKDKLVARLAIGATSRADGSLLLLVHEGKDFKLASYPASGKPAERTLVDFASAGDVGLVRDWVVSRGDAKAPRPRLTVRKIATDTLADQGPLVEVGDLPEGGIDKAAKDDVFGGCFTDDATVVRVRGATDTVAFYTAGRWSAPVKAGTHAGTLTCRGVEAVLTEVVNAVEGDRNYATVVQSRCNSSECQTTRLSLKELFSGAPDVIPPDAASVAAADVAGKLLLVWNTGLVGGVRMRFAPADRLKQTEDTIITDAREPGNKLSTFVEMRAIAAADYGLLFVTTTAGPRVLRVDASGKLTPVQGSL
jgi:hypothetical protein